MIKAKIEYTWETKDDDSSYWTQPDDSKIGIKEFQTEKDMIEFGLNSCNKIILSKKNEYWDKGDFDYNLELYNWYRE